MGALDMLHQYEAERRAAAEEKQRKLEERRKARAAEAQATVIGTIAQLRETAPVHFVKCATCDTDTPQDVSDPHTLCPACRSVVAGLCDDAVALKKEREANRVKNATEEERRRIAAMWREAHADVLVEADAKKRQKKHLLRTGALKSQKSKKRDEKHDGGKSLQRRVAAQKKSAQKKEKTP